MMKLIHHFNSFNSLEQVNGKILLSLQWNNIDNRFKIFNLQGRSNNKIQAGGEITGNDRLRELGIGNDPLK